MLLHVRLISYLSHVTANIKKKLVQIFSTVSFAGASLLL
jgi:hypothetical protein